MTIPAWYDQAACAGQPAGLFYGPPDETLRARQERERAAERHRRHGRRGRAV